MIWMLRWHIARFPVHLGFYIAPRCNARTMYVKAMEDVSAEIMTAISRAALEGEKP